MNELPIIVVHYSPLKNRYEFLEKKLPQQTHWITEESELPNIRLNQENKKVFGISERLVGMDLGVTARSLIKSRRKARIEGYILFCMSFLGRRRKKYTIGSLPPKAPLSNNHLELQKMHFAAVLKGIECNKPWFLVLEDDAILNQNSIQVIIKLIDHLPKREIIWVNLNSGAGLGRTESDKASDEHGLYKIVPASTRCTTSYLISLEFAKKFKLIVENYGMPNWLPIDYIFNVALRKTKATAYWQDPPIILQGSESGAYPSNLRKNASVKFEYYDNEKNLGYSN